MTIEERAEKAVAIRAQGRGNCCQSVVLALADLTPLTEEQLASAASGFGGGMGNREGSCGALVGAGLAAGLYDGEKPLRFGKMISDDFLSHCGAVICKELKRVENGKPLCPCEECIRAAVRACGRALSLE